MSAYLPPHGRFSSSGPSIASQRIAVGHVSPRYRNRRGERSDERKGEQTQGLHGDHERQVGAAVGGGGGEDGGDTPGRRCEIAVGASVPVGYSSSMPGAVTSAAR